ncbi:uncharacterized protein LOC127787541 [Diospyros lotus]|uniref:uncharacterized protein LOC127787541 n=1 Tax=Diospyros lotus TaxID=55363 RepID=UPI00225B0744|nr:uncharacterized protein LOC127787541 [Diospyros lotus]
MAINNRTLKELAAPDLNQQSLCIEYPNLDAAFELKSGLIHLLPTFHGLVGEDPHKHLKEFHVVCSSLKPQGVTEEQIKLRAFPFSLADAAKDWLFYLPPGNLQQVKACGICVVTGHAMDMCPTLQEDSLEHVNAVEGFLGPPKMKYDPYSNTYNLGWGIIPTSVMEQDHNSNIINLDHIFHHNKLLQVQETRTSIKQLENQISQLATSVSRLKAQGYGELPSQTVVNPRENVSAITLRSGKEIDIPVQNPIELAKKTQKEEAENEAIISSKVISQTIVHNSDKPNPLPFPIRLSKSKKEDQEKDILEIFRKVEVNIPLLDAIKQVPRYAKFLKELCTNKRKLKDNEKVSMGENVSAILQKKLPPKCKDPGMFTIPCKVGNVKIEKAMLDLGASINVMPLSIYSSLNIGPLKETGVTIQLADRSNVYPEGVLEDVLVQVNELVFLVDFYVLNMEEDDSSNIAPILLGRPFLKTSRTKIDVHDGTLTMEFDGEIVKFNIFDDTRLKLMPVEVRSLGTNKVFKVNGHRLKPFHEGFQEQTADEVQLRDPT